MTIGMLKQSQVRTNRAALDAAEPDDDVGRIAGLHLEELVIVEDAGDHLVHVVGLVRRIRDQRVELDVLVGEVVLDATCRHRHRVARRVCVIVARKVAQQLANVVEGVLLARCDVVRCAGLGHVCVRATQLLHRDVLAGDGLDHVGAGDEHLAGLIDHDDEVGQRG
jgi:hypothetical protein